MSQLNTKRWYQYPEVIDLITNGGEHPAPAGIRKYEKKTCNKWDFVEEEEIREYEG
jgi:hypothetical protein